MCIYMIPGCGLWAPPHGMVRNVDWCPIRTHTTRRRGNDETRKRKDERVPRVKQKCKNEKTKTRTATIMAYGTEETKHGDAETTKHGNAKTNT